MRRKEMKKEASVKEEVEEWKEDGKRIEGRNQELDTAGLELEVKIEERGIKQGYPMRRGKRDGRGTDG